MTPVPVPGQESPKHEPEFVPDIGQSKSWAAAVKGMADKPFLSTAKYHQQQKRAVRVGAHPHILEFERRFVRGMAKLSVPVFASEVIRTPERQTQLHADGFSKLKGEEGPHTKGRAVDLIHSGKGWALTDHQWLVMGHVGKELAKAMGLADLMVWGGDWKPNANGVGWDPAHWEVRIDPVEAAEYPFPALTKWEKGWRKKLKALQAVNPS